MAKFPDCIRSTLAASKTLIALSLISCRWPLEDVRRIPIVADMACRLATLICPAVTALAMSLGSVIVSSGIVRKSVGEGKSVAVRVVLGGCGIFKKKYNGRI